MRRLYYMLLITLGIFFLTGCAKEETKVDINTTTQTVADVIENQIKEAETSQESTEKEVENKEKGQQVSDNVLDIQGIEESLKDNENDRRNPTDNITIEPKKEEAKPIQEEQEKSAEVEEKPTEQEQEDKPVVSVPQENSLEGPPEILFSEIENGEGVVDLTTMTASMVYAILNQLMIAPKEYIGKTIVMEGTYESMYDEFTKMYYHYAIVTDSLACCSQGLEFVWEDGSHVYPDEYPELGEAIRITGVFETYKVEGQDYVYSRLNKATMERLK